VPDEPDEPDEPDSVWLAAGTFWVVEPEGRDERERFDTSGSILETGWTRREATG
jgi:hypothetical protein